MLSLKQFLWSKTIWVTALCLVFNAVQGTYHIVPADTATDINLFLAGLIGAARVSNTTNKTN